MAAAYTVTNSIHAGVGKDPILAPVDQILDPFDVGRRETIGVSLVVGQVGVDSVDVVVDHRSCASCAFDAGSLKLGVRSDFIRGSSYPMYSEVICLLKIS